MSIIHRLRDPSFLGKSIADTYKHLGSGDTPHIYEQEFKVITTFDVPWGAGNSLDRKRVYVDRRLYQEVIDGVVAVPGMTPHDIIEAWTEHEHTEISVVSGDNPIDLYPAAHECALCKEHQRIAAKGIPVPAYEEAIWGGLKRCYYRDFDSVPPDIWCGPVVDRPGERDRTIIKKLVSLGVNDALKESKYEAHYGVGGERCGDCKSYRPMEAQNTRGLCKKLCGPVRYDRDCDRWQQIQGEGVGTVQLLIDPLSRLKELK